MENMIFCQSCAMPLQKAEDHGTNADGTPNADYCIHCFGEGQFLVEETMAEMIESCVPFVLGGKPYHTEEEARAGMRAFFPTLKRWKSQ